MLKKVNIEQGRLVLWGNFQQSFRSSIGPSLWTRNLPHFVQTFIFRLLALIDDDHLLRGLGKDQFGTCDPSLLNPHEAHLCLLGIAILGQSPPLSLKLPRPHLDRFLCWITSCPNPNSFLLSRSDCCCCFSQCTTLPHHWRLCIMSSLKHLSALAYRVMGKLICVTYSTFNGRWSHQKHPFWRPAKEPEQEVHWL